MLDPFADALAEPLLDRLLIQFFDPQTCLSKLSYPSCDRLLARFLDVWFLGVPAILIQCLIDVRVRADLTFDVDVDGAAR